MLKVGLLLVDKILMAMIFLLMHLMLMLSLALALAHGGLHVVRCNNQVHQEEEKKSLLHFIIIPCPPSPPLPRVRLVVESFWVHLINESANIKSWITFRSNFKKDKVVLIERLVPLDLGWLCM